MDMPQDVWTAIKLLKVGYTGSRVLHDAAALCREAHPQAWQRDFARRYTRAIDALLSGHPLQDFIRPLGIEAPALGDVWVGRTKTRRPAAPASP